MFPASCASRMPISWKSPSVLSWRSQKTVEFQHVLDGITGNLWAILGNYDLIVG